MKLQAPTVLLVGAAAALGVFVAVTEVRQPDTTEGTAEQRSLFEFEEADVTAMTVDTGNTVLSFEKEGDQWHMRSPQSSPASESSVVFLVNLIASGVSDRVFEVAPDDLGGFGFENPLAEVEVTLTNDDTHRLILGDYDFNRSNIYGLTESPDDMDTADGAASDDTAITDASDPDASDPETVDVLIVPPSFETAVTRPLEDWLQAPAAETDPEADPDAESDADPDADPEPSSDPDPDDNLAPEPDIDPESAPSEPESSDLEPSVEPEANPN